MDSADTIPAKSITTTMRLVGFDADVARAHGYEIVTLPDGSRASVLAAKADAARRGEYVPTTGVVKADTAVSGEMTSDAYAEKGGECGMSYVALWAIGSANATLHTGFSLIPDAGEPATVSWSVGISDNGGNSTQRYGKGDGNTTGHAWTAHLRLLHLTRGNAIAGVSTGWTLTWGGWLCYSYGPSTSEYIY